MENIFDGKISWDLPVYMHRTNPIPLDGSSIFTSYDEALEYAKTNSTAFNGQPITVTSEDEDTEETSVKLYLTNKVRTDDAELVAVGSDSVPQLSISVTYNELKSLRDNNQLVVGVFYRITDFVTTTNGHCNGWTSTGFEDTARSAGHQFDIIIQALGTNNFNSECKAALHEGDTYFAGVNIDAWILYYDLDNDTSKYSWADTENGKGVIFRMIDDRGNDVGYDFKNIQFYRDNTDEKYTDIAEILHSTDGYYYTFSYYKKDESGQYTDEVYDFSLDNATNNYIERNTGYFDGSSFETQTKYNLNNSIFINSASNNKCSNGFCCNTICAGDGESNIFDSLMCNNIINCGYFISNKFANRFYSNKFINCTRFMYNEFKSQTADVVVKNCTDFNSNIFNYTTFTNTIQNAKEFRANVFASKFDRCTFDLANCQMINNQFNDSIEGTNILLTSTNDAFNYNIFNGIFSQNTVKYYFCNNICGTLFCNNTFEGDFFQNSVGNACNTNTFYYTGSCTFGHGFCYNNVGVHNWYNNFGNDVKYIKTPSGASKKRFRYYTIKDGLQGTKTALLDLTGLGLQNVMPTTVEQDANGVVYATWRNGVNTVGKYKAKTATEWTDIPTE